MIGEGTMRISAILLAAGASARMGENKLSLNFGGKSALALSYEAIKHSRYPIEKIVIAAADSTRDDGGAYRDAGCRRLGCRRRGQPGAIGL